MTLFTVAAAPAGGPGEVTGTRTEGNVVSPQPGVIRSGPAQWTRIPGVSCSVLVAPGAIGVGAM